MVKGVVSPDDALARLMRGNERFVGQRAKNPRSNLARVELTGTDGQYPFASILSCADSRVPAERVFDEGVGDLFVVRVAGNVTGPHETGSLEFGVAALGTNLRVVMGHTKCGAVNAVAADAQLFGSLPSLAARIQPAVNETRAAYPNADLATLTERSVEANVRSTMAELMRTSATLADGVRSGNLKIVGAVYDLNTGKVNFMGEHPEQSRILQMAPRS